MSNDATFNFTTDGWCSFDAKATYHSIGHDIASHDGWTFEADEFDNEPYTWSGPQRILVMYDTKGDFRKSVRGWHLADECTDLADVEYSILEQIGREWVEHGNAPRSIPDNWEAMTDQELAEFKEEHYPDGCSGMFNDETFVETEPVEAVRVRGVYEEFSWKHGVSHHQGSVHFEGELKGSWIYLDSGKKKFASGNHITYHHL